MTGLLVGLEVAGIVTVTVEVRWEGMVMTPMDLGGRLGVGAVRMIVVETVNLGVVVMTFVGVRGPCQAGRVDASLNSVLVSPPSLTNISGTANAVL